MAKEDDQSIKVLQESLEEFATKIGKSLGQFEEKIKNVSDSVAKLQARLENLETNKQKQKQKQKQKPSVASKTPSKRKEKDLIDDALRMIDS